MHLQEHLRSYSSVTKRAVDPDHRHLDQVGGRALDRRVRGGSLSERADVEVPVADLGDVAPAAEQRRDVSVGARMLYLRVEIRANARESLEVALDEGLGVG